MVARAFAFEESPSITRQWCQLTTGESDFKESATERYRQRNLVRVERRGKSTPCL